MVNAIDVGSLLFREILRMYEYPGAPFTGDIIRDLVTFFFVPTVFLIAVIYFSTGIIFGPGWRGMRLLFGLAAYLFVIVSGYFSIFAYIAGPYFFFLIIVVGIVYFIGRHFRRPGLREGGAPTPPSAMPAEAVARSRSDILDELDRVKKSLADAHKQLANVPRGSDEAKFWAERISRLEDRKKELEDELRILPKFRL